MKIELCNNYKIYKVVRKGNDFGIKEFKLLKIQNNTYYVVDPLTNKTYTYQVSNSLFFDKTEAVRQAKSLKRHFENKNYNSTDRSTLLEQIIKHNNMSIGQKWYKVYNTTEGAKIETHTIKEFLYNAILTTDDCEHEHKFYLADITTLLTENEKDEEYKRLVALGPQIRYEREICWHCRNFFEKRPDRQCIACNYYVCPVCGSCLCNHTYIPKAFYE